MLLDLSGAAAPLHREGGGNVTLPPWHGAKAAALRQRSRLKPAEDGCPGDRSAEPVGAVSNAIVLWRPLLAEARAIVRGYAAALGLAPIDDPSNDDRGLRRNALRHEVMPELERVSPGAAEALARYARLAADDDAALEALAATTYRRAVTRDGDLLRFVLAGEPVAARRRVVRRWVEERAGLTSLTADRVEAILALAERGERGRWVEIGERVVVQAAGPVIRVELPPAGERERA